MNEISIVIIVLIIFMIIKAINQKRKSTVQTTQTFKKTEENTEKNNNINKNQYKKKNFLTCTEKKFLSALHELKKYDLIIIPQVNLATIIQKQVNLNIKMNYIEILILVYLIKIIIFYF